MRRIVGFIAVTLDGYIARPDGGLDFLEAYPAESPEYDAMVSAIGTVVMGRDTYDVIRRHMDWPYGDKRALVVTTRPVEGLPDGAEGWTSGDVDGLLAHLRHGALPPGDVWVIGGGRLQQAFIDRGEMDRLDVFLLPEILGDGIPMIPRGAQRRTLRLLETAPWGDRGVVRLTYAC